VPTPLRCAKKRLQIRAGGRIDAHAGRWCGCRAVHHGAFERPGQRLVLRVFAGRVVRHRVGRVVPTMGRRHRFVVRKEPRPLWKSPLEIPIAIVLISSSLIAKKQRQNANDEEFSPPRHQGKQRRLNSLPFLVPWCLGGKVLSSELRPLLSFPFVLPLILPPFNFPRLSFGFYGWINWLGVMVVPSIVH
jgi:hypothetical protein